MAAELIRMKAATENIADRIVVESRGIRAVNGELVSKHAAELFAEMGRSLDGHRSQKLSRDEFEAVDLVLVMTDEHRQRLRELAPKQLQKVYLFSELAADGADEHGQATDIVDPYGQSKEVYHATLLELKLIVDQGWASLIEKLSLT